MGNISERSDVRQRAGRLLELLDRMHLSNLDFDNREHLQVIELCIDMAIDHAEKMSARRTTDRPLSPVGPECPALPISQK